MGKLGKQTVYVKQGGYQRAIDDLNSVKPTMVRDPRKYGKVSHTEPLNEPTMVTGCNNFCQ